MIDPKQNPLVIAKLTSRPRSALLIPTTSPGSTSKDTSFNAQNPSTGGALWITFSGALRELTIASRSV